MKKILICFGTRAEYIKLKSLIDNLPNAITCFTGQHENLLKNIKADYIIKIINGISKNRINNIYCNVMANDQIFENADYVMVHGDTSSALAVAL
jgi:UDP-N-acetylglucosamine 2-epimerase